MTGMLPIGSTSMTPAGVVPAAPSPSSALGLTTSPGAGAFQPAPCIRAAASSRCVLQASPGLPFIRTPHEPQMACWQEQRIPTEPSTSSRTLRIASSTELRSPSSTRCSSQ